MIGLHVLVAHYALLVLIGLTPFTLFFDQLWLEGVLEIYTAATVAMVALSIRPGEAGHWFKTVRWPAILAGIPLLWLASQVLPLPFGSVSRSIWQSAGVALGTPLMPSVTIDPGLTLLSFLRYASITAIGLVAAAVSIDRQQAEQLLLVLGAATFGLSIVSAIYFLGGLAFLDRNALAGVPAAAVAGSVYGVVLFAAIIILIIERHLTRRNSQDFRRQFLLPLIAGIGGLVLCALAILLAGSGPGVFAAGCGLVTIAVIQFVRRIGLDWRAAALMFCVATIGAAVIVSTKTQPLPADFSMRYSAQPSSDLISVADRLVREVGVGGSGAGTFQSIYRLYAPQALSNDVILAPTTASQISIELGRPALWIIVAFLGALIFLCARGAFNRGRDFFYSVSGVGVGVASLVLAFSDIGLNGLAISILLAATLGLALVQSVSRTL